MRAGSRAGGWAKAGGHESEMLHAVMADVFGSPDPIRRFLDAHPDARDHYRAQRAVRTLRRPGGPGRLHRWPPRPRCSPAAQGADRRRGRRVRGCGPSVGGRPDARAEERLEEFNRELERVGAQAQHDHAERNRTGNCFDDEYYDGLSGRCMYRGDEFYAEDDAYEEEDLYDDDGPEPQEP